MHLVMGMKNKMSVYVLSEGFIDDQEQIVTYIDYRYLYIFRARTISAAGRWT
jgi:hypothetical protein